MKSFLVTYLDGRGRRSETLVSADTIDDARLESQGFGQILQIKPLRKSQSKGKMSLSDRLVFMQRLASMLASRVGASEALDVIHSSFTGPVKEAARIMKDQLENHGASFSEAMTVAGPRYFPAATVAIVHTGSQGGDLAYALREAARFEKEIADLKKESGKGLLSALGSFVIGIVVILASTLYVAPLMLNSGFTEKSGDGASSMDWMMSMSSWLTYAASLAGFLIVSLFIVNVALKPIAPVFVDQLILRIPYYRDMVLARSNYMVFFGLAILLKAGLRIEQAFSLTIETAPKGELRKDLERARDSIMNDGSAEWPYAMKMLHPTDRAALATAQDREQIAGTIEDLALQYRTLYRARLEAIVPILQVFSATFLSLAGFLLFAISTIPLLESSSNILGGL